MNDEMSIDAIQRHEFKMWAKHNRVMNNEEAFKIWKMARQPLLEAIDLVHEEVNDTLFAYAQEIGLYKPEETTLKDLIASHRRLRTDSRRARDEEAKERGERIDHAVAIHIKMLEENGYFSRERLRGMTLGQFADVIAEEHDDL